MKKVKLTKFIIDGVGILYGIEANIKNIKGETDCSEKMSKKLDLSHIRKK